MKTENQTEGQPQVATSDVVCDGPEDMAALKARLRWWLRGWLRAYEGSRYIHRQGKAGIRGMMAVQRSQRLVP